MEDWSDPAVARAWAERNPPDNPARKEMLDLLLNVMRRYLDDSQVPRSVLDLGCGHGVVAARVLGEVERTTLVGVDGSPIMLAMARERLAPYAGRFQLAQVDFERVTPGDLPGGPFGAAIAVQSIHNSSDEGKQRTLAAARAAMAPGAIFLLLDRIRMATPSLFPAYRGLWDQLGPQFYAQQYEGDTLEEHERMVAARGDKPGSLEQNVLWLREAGFTEVAALCVVGVRALVAGVVPR
jgi:tRNA (cmo5U34)-methyltransferase